MRQFSVKLGLLVWIVMVHPTRSQAGFTTVDATPTTLTSSTPIGIGG